MVIYGVESYQDESTLLPRDLLSQLEITYPISVLRFESAGNRMNEQENKVLGRRNYRGIESSRGAVESGQDDQGRQS